MCNLDYSFFFTNRLFILLKEGEVGIKKKKETD
jgi:hypothetical protein